MLFFLCIGFSLGAKNEEYVHPQSDYLHTDGDIFDVMMPQQIDTKPWLLLVSVPEKKKVTPFLFFF